MKHSTPTWRASERDAAAWGARLWAEDYFRPLRDFIHRADEGFTPTWQGVVHKDDDAHAAWSAVTEFDRGNICLSADFALFGTVGDEHPPVVGEMVVEAAIVFRSSMRGRAQGRAEAAWENCLIGPAKLVTEGSLRTYPNTVRWHRPGITLCDDETGGSIEPLGVWTVARTGPMPMPLGPAALDGTLALARRDLPDLIDLFAHTVEVLRGAVYCDRKSVDRASVIGWCGEYAFWASQSASRPALRWVTALRSAHDFTDAGGVVEIKTTTDDAEGRAHFSPAELAELLRDPGRYAVVCVRVPERVVEGVLAALTGASGTAGQSLGSLPPQHRVAVSHLAVATGQPIERVVGAYAALRSFLTTLEALPAVAITDTASPLAWLVPVSKELLARGAGIDVMFDRI